MNVRHELVLEHSAELVFALLPFLLLSLVFLKNGSLENILSLSEWSFGASMLFGQALVKLAGGISNSTRKISPGYLRLYLTCIIVFGLAPSLTFVVLAVDGSKDGQVLPGWLQIIQVIYFALSCAVYLVIGVASSELVRAQQTSIPK